MERLGSEYSLEHKLGAYDLLKELPDDPEILQVLSSPSSMSKMQDLLQTEDEEVKSGAFRFLTNLIERHFTNSIKSAGEAEESEPSFKTIKSKAMMSFENPFAEDED
jgi:hypothetical protein